MPEAGPYDEESLENVDDESSDRDTGAAANRTSASGRLPNDPGPGVTGGGVDDMVAENLAQQQAPPDETILTAGEAESNKRANS